MQAIVAGAVAARRPALPAHVHHDAGAVAARRPALPAHVHHDAGAVPNDGGNHAAIQAIATPQTAHRTFCRPHCAAPLSQGQHDADRRHGQYRQCPGKEASWPR